MASVIRAFFQRLGGARRYVGRDLEGNKYYESPSAQLGLSRTKRHVVYKQGSDLYSYASGLSRLPVQWSAWMAHTRPHPPSIEELQADAARQQRVASLALQIEARDLQERLHYLPLPSSMAAPSSQASRRCVQTDSEEKTGEDRVADSSPAPAPGPAELRAQAQQRTKKEEPSVLRESIKNADSNDPQSWTPTTVRTRVPR